MPGRFLHQMVQQPSVYEGSDQSETKEYSRDRGEAVNVGWRCAVLIDHLDGDYLIWMRVSVGKQLNNILVECNVWVTKEYPVASSDPKRLLRREREPNVTRIVHHVKPYFYEARITSSKIFSSAVL